jgi:MoaA/NifB/PqqE/SkfB family radical SAM enzyme
VTELLDTFRKFDTKQVLMSGGEALLHPNFFRFCEILKGLNIKVTLLSTGLTLKRNAGQLVGNVNDIIVSIDGDETTHDSVRNINGAFNKLREGVLAIKAIKPGFRITGRSVIHKSNFRQWPGIINAASEIGLDQISFLPADVSSHAFNREILWDDARQHEVIPNRQELDELRSVIEALVIDHAEKFKDRFIAESPEKIRKIYQYYAAFYELNPFPYKKCNAPWVSTVIESDGTVRPCFFHPAYGNIRERSLEKILNSDELIDFRKRLDVDSNSTCVKCVCYLNLPPGANPAGNN